VVMGQRASGARKSHRDESVGRIAADLVIFA
jgi:hypothetical protein